MSGTLLSDLARGIFGGARAARGASGGKSTQIKHPSVTLRYTPLLLLGSVTSVRFRCMMDLFSVNPPAHGQRGVPRGGNRLK